MTKETGSTEERKTCELCGHVSPAGRCIRSSNHDGEHEFFPQLTDSYPFDAPTVRLK